MSTSRWSGWLAVAFFVGAALVPAVHRIAMGKRAAPLSPPMRGHVVLGLVTSSLAFGHTFLVLPALGEPSAIVGGVSSLAAAGAAFCLMVAHAGLGLQLRREKLRDRVKKRRSHLLTALAIAVAVGFHVYGLRG